jgi:AcrR family transcriptional regulator
MRRSNPASADRRPTRRSLVIREVLDKATELFGTQGYQATTLQDIAAATGISRSALYHYVSSKEELLEMLMEELIRALDDSLAALHSSADGPPEDQLRRLATELVRQRAERPDHFRVLNQSESALPESMRTQQERVRRTALTELRHVIEEGIRAGDFKAVDPRIAALGILGMCNWVAWWFRPGGDQDAEAITRQISQSAVDMLRDGGAHTASCSSRARGLDLRSPQPRHPRTTPALDRSDSCGPLTSTSDRPAPLVSTPGA